MNNASAVLNVAALLCSSFLRPKIAVCIHGAARSFPHLLVHATQKANLIDALGARATVFIHITRKDLRADPRPKYSGTFADSTEEQIWNAALHLGAELRRVRILDGPRAELPACPGYQQDMHFRQRQPNNTAHVLTLEYLYSLAGQLSHHEGCMNLVREEEASTKSRFHEIILARADLTVYSPLLPYCMLKHRKPRRLWDWYYHVPRRMAERVFSEPFRRFYGCQQNLRMGRTIESYRHSNLADVQEDLTLPMIITRLDQSNMPNNLCAIFNQTGTRSRLDDLDRTALCGPMTYQNPYNMVV
eukprot:TRINITY_DN64415_c0_g1_i1.p1 TRINITY_DN64415_c0_g1~~TRINITY_DN64415_c0_g1_i1.p1  ORF type:complete len:302 (+),score=22.26 TRINITY_DN64415_c0_g1_i1:95-1000(+)